MLLQALDLLDRGLVTRLVQCAPVPPPPADRIIAAEGKEKGTEREVKPPHAHVHLPSSPPLPMEGIGVEQARQAREGKGKVEDGRRNVVYQVRSSQAMRLGRFKSNHVPGNEITAVGIGSMVYTVRLEAWNCSCAAFTFAAFPGGGSGGGYWGGKAWDSEDEDVMDRFEGSSQREWQFGGLGFDGMDLGNGEGGSGNMPICKHLLACLLGERWEGVLGSYVMVRDVGREVMAGVGGEG
jgi:hypothetical protein